MGHTRRLFALTAGLTLGWGAEIAVAQLPTLGDGGPASYQGAPPSN